MSKPWQRVTPVLLLPPPAPVTSPPTHLPTHHLTLIMDPVSHHATLSHATPRSSSRCVSYIGLSSHYSPSFGVRIVSHISLYNDHHAVWIFHLYSDIFKDLHFIRRHHEHILLLGFVKSLGKLIIILVTSTFQPPVCLNEGSVYRWS